MTTKIWKDENGITIPASRVTKSEKLREQVIERLLKRAQKLSQELAKFKDEFANTSDEVYDAVMAENGVDTTDRKGNFCFYNFDRTIKAEVDVSDRIEFDDAMIAVAKQHFDIFLDNTTGGVDEMIRELILDAFSTVKGKLDTKKVMTLVKYRQRIDPNKYPQFHKAIDAIEKGMRKPSSRRYYRISVRNSQGGYDAINLNFSSL
jgi:hypothetical protein